jgi:transposase-like protein
MTTKEPPKGSSGRKYSPEERAQAVRLVRQLRRELGTDKGTVGRVARQLC